MATTGYQAGVDSSDVEISYGIEAAWGVKPAVAFKKVRMSSEGFSSEKTRARPPEIRSDGQAAHGVTTQEAATGSLGLLFAYGVYDDLLASLLNGVWSTELDINGAAGDIDAVASSSTFESGTAGKFADVVVGQWISVFGFSNEENNGAFRVTAKAVNNLTITVEGTLVDETPSGTSAAIRGKYLRNGVTVNTLHVQKKLAAALYLVYPGSYPSSASITASVGGFMEGNMSFLSKSEDKATSSQSTGSEVEAPDGRVIDTVAGFSNAQIDDSAIASVIQSLTVDLTKNNARSQYGLGSAASRGMGRGTLTVTGTLSVYFKDFTLYDMYKAETDHLISFKALDNAGEGYIITLPATTLLNPKVMAGGEDTDVMAEFSLEASKDSTYGCTIQIDAIPGTA